MEIICSGRYQQHWQRGSVAAVSRTVNSSIKALASLYLSVNQVRARFMSGVTARQ